MKLKKSDERGHPCLVPDVSWKDSSFSLLSIMLVVDFFIDILYQDEEFSSIPSFLHSFFLVFLYHYH